MAFQSQQYWSVRVAIDPNATITHKCFFKSFSQLISQKRAKLDFNQPIVMFPPPQKKITFFLMYPQKTFPSSVQFSP